MQKRLSFLSTAVAACAIAMLSACASGDSGTSRPPRVPDSPALAQAKEQQRAVDWKIVQSESSMRRLSPPVRTTTNGVTTFNVDKQRQYEQDRQRAENQIRDLRNERLVWDLRVSQIIQQESLMAQQPAGVPMQQVVPMIQMVPIQQGMLMQQGMPMQQVAPIQQGMPAPMGMPAPQGMTVQPGMPAQSGMPYQQGMPSQPGMPAQSGMPYQQGVPSQSGMPAQSGMPPQSGMPAK